MVSEVFPVYLSFVFVRRTHAAARLIRWFDGGEYDHVAILLADGHNVIEAVSSKGVIVRSLESMLSDPSIERHQVVTVRVLSTREDLARATDALMGSRGMPYDRWALLSIAWAKLLGRAPNFDSLGAWFCSEHGATWAECFSVDVPGTARRCGPRVLFEALAAHNAQS